MSKTRLSVETLKTDQIGPYSLEIAAGECVSLSGPSGSGKSLFLRAIADLDPHEGRVSLDDIECKKISAPLWRKKVSLVPAESQWWFDDVGAHFSAHTAEEIQPYLETLGFENLTLDWQVSRLSTGEKQRLALARALMNQPQVLLLDEPTGSLDPHSTTAVEQLVANYQRQTGAAVLWVSHDANQTARVSTRHLVISPDGFISPDGHMNSGGQWSTDNQEAKSP